MHKYIPYTEMIYQHNYYCYLYANLNFVLHEMVANDYINSVLHSWLMLLQTPVISCLHADQYSLKLHSPIITSTYMSIMYQHTQIKLDCNMNYWHATYVTFRAYICPPVGQFTKNCSRAVHHTLWNGVVPYRYTITFH